MRKTLIYMILIIPLITHAFIIDMQDTAFNIVAFAMVCLVYFLASLELAKSLSE